MATLGFVMREGKCAQEVLTRRENELTIKPHDFQILSRVSCFEKQSENAMHRYSICVVCTLWDMFILVQVQTNPSDVRIHWAPHPSDALMWRQPSLNRFEWQACATGRGREEDPARALDSSCTSLTV